MERENSNFKYNNFNLSYIETLNIEQSKKYIDEYFIPLYNAYHAVKVNGDYEIKDANEIKHVYFNRLDKKLATYYFTEKKDIRRITYELEKPKLYTENGIDYLNMCPGFKHEYQPYESFNKKIKKGVETILKHIRICYCANDDDNYNFLLKWFANLARAQRNSSILYLKGEQGAGKSCVCQFLREYVFGNQITYEGGSAPLTSRFNGELSSKLFVVFEELESFSMSEWVGISSKLKRQSTSNTIMIERKNQTAVQEKNLNNYVILTNNDAIKDSEGRRYYELPISHELIGNYAYFDNLYKYFNDDVGKAFYSFLKEVDLTNYDSLKFPITSAKIDNINNRMDSVFKFLKINYILPKQSLNISSRALYNEYCQFIHPSKPKSTIDFSNKLKTINITTKKINGLMMYKYDAQILINTAKSKNWIHELDEFDENSKILEHVEPDNSDLLKEIEELKKQLNEYKKNAEKPKKKKTKPVEDETTVETVEEEPKKKPKKKKTKPVEDETTVETVEEEPKKKPKKKKTKPVEEPKKNYEENEDDSEDDEDDNFTNVSSKNADYDDVEFIDDDEIKNIDIDF